MLALASILKAPLWRNRSGLRHKGACLIGMSDWLLLQSPSTINHQPSTINHQSSTINHQPSFMPPPLTFPERPAPSRIQSAYLPLFRKLP